MIIKLTILWIIFACLDGFVQAFYYDLQPCEKKHIDLHRYYTIQRFIIALFIIIALSYIYSLLTSLIFIIALSCMFSFFHNGCYYTTRHYLNKNIYTKKFFDNSTTSTAIVELNFVNRTVLLIIGVVIIISIYIYG